MLKFFWSPNTCTEEVFNTSMYYIYVAFIYFSRRFKNPDRKHIECGPRSLPTQSQGKSFHNDLNASPLFLFYVDKLTCLSISARPRKTERSNSVLRFVFPPTYRDFSRRQISDVISITWYVSNYNVFPVFRDNGTVSRGDWWCESHLFASLSLFCDKINGEFFISSHFFLTTRDNRITRESSPSAERVVKTGNFSPKRSHKSFRPCKQINMYLF